MKRFLSILLVAILMVTSLGTVVAATEIVSKPGEVVSVPVTVSGEFANFLVSVSVDSGLTIQSIDGAGASVVDSATTGKANWASAGNVTEFTFYVTVLVDTEIAPGTYNVYATVERASKAVPMEEDTEDGVKNGLVATTVSVACDSVKILCDHVWGEWTTTKEATCTVKGEKTRTCSVCGETETQEIAATGHSWGDWTTTKDATCTAKGEKTRTCSGCGETETEEIAATGKHTWGDWATTKEATCTAKGEKTRTCSVCGETETEEIAATGHTWGEWTTTKDATCTAKGEKTRTCSVCGETEHTDIAMIDHNYGWQYDDTDHWLVCDACGATTEKEAHKHDIKGDDGYYYCECGHKGDKIPVNAPADDPNKDDVPKTGDITLQVVMGGTAVVIAMFAAIAFVFKRKTAK